MLLRFDFNQHPVIFRQPKRVIQTHSLGEVKQKMVEVEYAIEQGFYAAGFISYEAASGFIPYHHTKASSPLPLLWFGLFDTCEEAPSLPTYFTPPKLNWQCDTTYDEYQQAIKAIHYHIESGNTYQVNYTVRLSSPFQSDDAYPFYAYLHQAQQANYSAYLDIDHFTILSASPELFFQLKDHKIITKPMKGTVARGMTYQSDQHQKIKLAHSTKDQAENVMIVDLLRNDLSQIADIGSVKVDKLFSVEPYPTVWQMTSTIRASLPPSRSLFDIFTALFPCGSITGAPKANTMSIIADLEKSPRGIYCGAIGYITPQKEAIFNVPIRTVLIDKSQQQAYYGVGGGITWDSSSDNEYDEVLQKSRVLENIYTPPSLIETLLLKTGSYTLFDLHLKRLSESADYFSFHYNQQHVLAILQQVAEQHKQGIWKVRLLLSRTGECHIDIDNLPNHPLPNLQATWAPNAITRQNPLLYHKTSLRSHYPYATLEHEYLLYNEEDEITEFVNGNVVLKINGEYLTPCVSSGLLNGTFRQSLLQDHQIKESILSKDQLQNAEEIWFINSVREWRKVIFTH